MADIPDGIDFQVAKVAVAWEIARKAVDKRGLAETKGTEELADLYIKLFNKAYAELTNSPEE